MVRVYQLLSITLNDLSCVCIVVDFVLKDPREREDEKKDHLPPHREELNVVPSPTSS